MFFRFNRVLWTDPSGERGMVTREILRQFRKEDGFTFMDFLVYLKSTPNNERDIHYRSQDIPAIYDHLIRTDGYFEDVLVFFGKVGYERGVQMLSDKTSQDIIANSVKKGRNIAWGDVSGLRTFDFEKFETSGYPPYDLFLHQEARKAIEEIFREEIAWYCQFSS